METDIVIISRLKFIGKVQKGDKINVKVVGQRFELNDKYVSIIGELMKEKEQIPFDKFKSKSKPRLVIEDE